ncbi:restriction system protein [Pseudomonas nitritireducens]|uniref:Restriction system protein n=1 Tax=Pseudomonas nitroreducens TaxID=46680 RepID=A0A7W7KSR0_PSENT|nr:restriction endonuclease [Pseudomonas nitritireducens]MBB4868106.1 restriction system protein [Pseudomonas nitritireducens]
MARRRKTSTFEDLIFIASRLPWWVSLLIALGAWLVLHPFAISKPPTAVNPQQFADAMTGQVWRTFALFLQYLIPAAFVLGAIGSIAGRAKRKRLAYDVARATETGKTIDGISWREFEQLVGEVFRQKGFTVTETGGNGSDGGIDLVLQMGTDKYLVQCKQWRAIKVGVTVIREFFGVMAAQGASGGFVVTSGTYTEDAKEFAKGRNIQLVDGTLVKRWLAGRSEARNRQGSRDEPLKATEVSTAPSCPACSAPMVKRIAKRGANAGGEFWGCSQFPVCRGIRNTV